MDDIHFLICGWIMFLNTSVGMVYYIFPQHMGCYGNPIYTPNIPQIGMSFIFGFGYGLELASGPRILGYESSLTSICGVHQGRRVLSHNDFLFYCCCSMGVSFSMIFRIINFRHVWRYTLNSPSEKHANCSTNLLRQFSATPVFKTKCTECV